MAGVAAADHICGASTMAAVSPENYAIVSNILFIAYAPMMGFIPALALNVALLPINIIYLASEFRKPTR